jgi:hypothetical protein
LQDEAEAWRWIDEEETRRGMAKFDRAFKVAEAAEAVAAEAAIVAAAADPVGFRVMRKHMDRLPFRKNG